MRWAQLTDRGLVRSLNEDSLCVSPEIGLFAVADGMGGHLAGEVASATALQMLEQDLGKRLQNGEFPQHALVNAVQGANRKIFELAGSNQQWAGMGTTLTACLKREEVIYIAQVGDSRAYLLREGRIAQLTEDHSLVRELVKNGGLTEEQALQHPQRNVLTRALGIAPSLTVDLYLHKVGPGDLLLLCTDGLTGYLRPEEIMFTVRTSPNLDTAARVLVDKALGAGGKDNITVILLEI
ncbi:Serine/threonine phosphatase stp [Pelotomaculum sp. FP]|uniref:Stp1/IreP family PP2C-type Ser/Thr phosphatase n=1 Tax=Pelotomaculum sp. FP TaxID=261474 RepID=UPI001066CEAB|nr:Stp1/IreP family PP2C-type Ser/Thr phosphatase [Pelotomaculum sp. FP]TEB17905.1 Serine/threonine phosphatase stp [Pelotomaculum sp. FP]